MERRTNRVRDMYYFDGSAVRKNDSYFEEAPLRKEREYEVPRKKRRPVTDEKAARKAEKSLAFDLKYTMFLVAAVFIIAASCAVMLAAESRVDGQQDSIENKEVILDELNENNSAARDSINSMYTLEDIYDIATTELEMVYAEKGQVVYYESANEDYVKQYQDVPGAE